MARIIPDRGMMPAEVVYVSTEQQVFDTCRAVCCRLLKTAGLKIGPIAISAATAGISNSMGAKQDTIITAATITYCVSQLFSAPFYLVKISERFDLQHKTISALNVISERVAALSDLYDDMMETITKVEYGEISSQELLREEIATTLEKYHLNINGAAHEDMPRLADTFTISGDGPPSIELLKEQLIRAATDIQDTPIPTNKRSLTQLCTKITWIGFSVLQVTAAINVPWVTMIVSRDYDSTKTTLLTLGALDMLHSLITLVQE